MPLILQFVLFMLVLEAGVVGTGTSPSSSKGANFFTRAKHFLHHDEIADAFHDCNLFQTEQMQYKKEKINEFLKPLEKHHLHAVLDAIKTSKIGDEQLWFVVRMLKEENDYEKHLVANKKHYEAKTSSELCEKLKNLVKHFAIFNKSPEMNELFESEKENLYSLIQNIPSNAEQTEVLKTIEQINHLLDVHPSEQEASWHKACRSTKRTMQTMEIIYITFPKFPHSVEPNDATTNHSDNPNQNHVNRLVKVFQVLKEFAHLPAISDENASNSFNGKYQTIKELLRLTVHHFFYHQKNERDFLKLLSNFRPATINLKFVDKLTLLISNELHKHGYETEARKSKVYFMKKA